MTHGSTIILAPGWGETVATTTRLATVLQELGYQTVAAHHGRGGSHDAAAVMEARATDIVQLMEAHAGSVAVLAHSLGALDAVRAAELAPQGLDHLILANPAGLSGPMSTLRLASRFIRKKVMDRLRREDRIDPGESDFTWRLALAEGRAAARADVRPRLQALLDQGVTITVLATRRDIMFRYHDIETGLRDVSDNINLVEIGGRHDSIHHEAEEFRDVLKTVLHTD